MLLEYCEEAFEIIEFILVGLLSLMPLVVVHWADRASGPRWRLRWPHFRLGHFIHGNLRSVRLRLRWPRLRLGHFIGRNLKTARFRLAAVRATLLLTLSDWISRVLI